MNLSPPFDELCRGVPGEEILRKGLVDLSDGIESIESLLIQIGSSRLRFCGAPIPEVVDHDADYRLYARLSLAHGDDAHSQYNAWIRQLVSLERALEQRKPLAIAGCYPGIPGIG